MNSAIKAPTRERVPVEARYIKNNRGYVILLHVIKRQVAELEFVSFTDTPDSVYPKPKELEVVIT